MFKANTITEVLVVGGLEIGIEYALITVVVEVCPLCFEVFPVDEMGEFDQFMF